MERSLERDKSNMNQSEADQGRETQASRVTQKSPIHLSITRSNKEPISGKIKERSGEKVKTSTSMGNNNDVSKLSKKSAKQQRLSVGVETHETTQGKLSESTKSSGSDDSPESGKMETSSMDSQSDHANEETSKSDKRTLRKGKWAVEEEEYTSRVIQHFSAGLLTLPEGATLRSYLAEKLNCDPMRITKKFTGACCLGRRVYHLRDRPRASPAELEMAKAERDHLEQRFRMRVEHEQSGLPLSRRLDVLVAHPPGNVSTLFPNQHFTGGNSLSPWVQGFGTGQVDPFTFQRTVKQGLPVLPLVQAHIPVIPNSTQHNQSRWLFPGAGENIVSAPTPADPSLQLLNHLVTSWAVAQAAATLPPAALATLAAGSIPVPSAVPIANIRPQHQTTVPDAQLSPPQNDIHRQLRNAYEEQKKEEEQRQLRAAFEEEQRKEEAKRAAEMAAKTTATSISISAQDNSKDEDIATRKPEDVSPAELLQKSYEAHLQALKTRESTKEGSQSPIPPNPSSKVGIDEGSGCTPSEVTQTISTTSKTNNGGNENEQPMPDEEAGTVLLGFLNSLRQSFEDAVERKSNGDRGVANDKTESTTAVESSKPSSITPTSIMKDRRVDWKKKGTKRSPESNAKDNGQSDTMNTLSTAVSQYIAAKGGRRSQRPPSVTDVSSGNSSTQHGELSSSLEDSSDKTDPSSSEESEKEDPARKRWHSKGPPRKRVKLFTEKNLIEHSKRMNENGN